MVKNDVYIVMTEYRNFEDLDSNYSEINGVFDTKEKALNKCYYRFIEETENNMHCHNFIFDEDNSVKVLKNSINNQLTHFNCIKFYQNCGDGECNLFLIKKEVL